MTKTNKIKAVKKVFSLMKNGATLTDARAVVANECNVSSPTIANWQTTFGGDLTTTKTNTRTTIHTDYTFDDMSNGVRGVLRSIVNQDGKYTIKEANAVGKLYSAEISRAKVLIDVHKLNTKANDKKTLQLN